MKVLSIIPARGGSKGILMKNLIPLDKKPLLYYTIRSSLDSKYINRTIVSTDNHKIAKKAKQIGAEVVLRPKTLATDKIAIEPTIKYTLDQLKRSEQYEPEVVILLQNTSPLRTSNHIDEAMNLFMKGKYDSIASVFASHYLLWNSKNHNIRPVNYNPLKRPNRQQMKDQFIENGSIYITKYLSFRKSNCRISGRIGLYKMPEELSVQIDSLHDLFLVEEIIKNKKAIKWKK